MVQRSPLFVSNGAFTFVSSKWLLSYKYLHDRNACLKEDQINAIPQNKCDIWGVPKIRKLPIINMRRLHSRLVLATHINGEYDNI